MNLLAFILRSFIAPDAISVCKSAAFASCRASPSLSAVQRLLKDQFVALQASRIHFEPSLSGRIPVLPLTEDSYIDETDRRCCAGNAEKQVAIVAFVRLVDSRVGRATWADSLCFVVDVAILIVDDDAQTVFGCP